jgi:hypothetical protein
MRTIIKALVYMREFPWVTNNFSPRLHKRLDQITSVISAYLYPDTTARQPISAGHGSKCGNTEAGDSLLFDCKVGLKGNSVILFYPQQEGLMGNSENLGPFQRRKNEPRKQYSGSRGTTTYMKRIQKYRKSTETDLEVNGKICIGVNRTRRKWKKIWTGACTGI